MAIKLIFSVLSRANFSRVKSVIKAAIDNPNIQPIVVVGCGAICDDYGSILKECEKDGIVIDEKISMLMHEKTKTNMVRTTALGMLDFSLILEKYKPDLALTVADRYETISFAISCSYMNVPLIHLQGGEPTGSIDDKVRNAIAQLADYHFVCTNHAHELTIKWGEKPGRVFNVGCPSLDHLLKISDTNLLKEKLENINNKLNLNVKFSVKYCVLLFHPDTRKNDQDFFKVIEGVLKFVDEERINLFILKPNPDYGSSQIVNYLEQLNKNKFSNVFLLNNLNSEDYINLIQGSEILIGNSSSGIRESSFLGIKSLNIGRRQEYRYKCSNVFDVDLSINKIYEALKKIYILEKPECSNTYGNGESSQKIIDLIQKLNFTIKPTKT